MMDGLIQCKVNKEEEALTNYFNRVEDLIDCGLANNIHL